MKGVGLPSEFLSIYSKDCSFIEIYIHQSCADIYLYGADRIVWEYAFYCVWECLYYWGIDSCSQEKKNVEEERNHSHFRIANCDRKESWLFISGAPFKIIQSKPGGLKSSGQKTSFLLLGFASLFCVYFQ